MENNQRQIIAAMMMQSFILRGEGTIEEAVKMADELIEATDGKKPKPIVERISERRRPCYVMDGQVFVYSDGKSHGYLTFDDILTTKIKAKGFDRCSVSVGNPTYIQLGLGDIKLDIGRKSVRAWGIGKVNEIMAKLGVQPCSLVDYDVIVENDDYIGIRITKKQ
jgi:hypothetical protein